MFTHCGNGGRRGLFLLAFTYTEESKITRVLQQYLVIQNLLCFVLWASFSVSILCISTKAFSPIYSHSFTHTESRAFLTNNALLSLFSKDPLCSLSTGESPHMIINDSASSDKILKQMCLNIYKCLPLSSTLGGLALIGN